MHRDTYNREVELLQSYRRTLTWWIEELNVTFKAALTNDEKEQIGATCAFFRYALRLMAVRADRIEFLLGNECPISKPEQETADWVMTTFPLRRK